MTTDLYDDQGRISLTAMRTLLRSVVHEELKPWGERLDKIEGCQADLHRAVGGNGYGMSEGLVGLVKELQDLLNIGQPTTLDAVLSSLLPSVPDK